MIRSKKSTINPAPVTSSSSVTDQLGALEKSLSSVVSLTKVARKQLEARSASVPDALIKKMIQIATKNGGVVAGMPFDVDAATATLTQVSDSQAAIDSSRTIAQKMRDSALQQRVQVADHAFGIYRALDRLVKTPEGNALLGTYEEMASTVRNRPRLPRKKTAAKASATTPATATEPTPAPEPPQATAPAAAPAATAVPAAGGTSHP